jgi:signal transduction histidine kinase
LRIAVVCAFVVLGAIVLFLTLFGVRQARNRLRSQILMGERKRMADDLHDTIEQHIVGAGMLLQLGKLKEVADVLLRAKKEMRDIVWGLKNDDMMRLSPSEMIRQYVKEENKKGMFRIDCILSGLPEKLDARLMRDLSLILREAVGNAIKHGEARKIAIASEKNGIDGWILRVSNDGKPYDAATALGVDQGHFGVEGMKARARRLGVKLSLCYDGRRTVLTLEKE